MSALQTGGGASPPSFEGSLLPGTPHQMGATYQSYLEGKGGAGGEREGVHTYLVHSTYIPYQNAYFGNRDKRVHKIANGIKKFA